MFPAAKDGNRKRVCCFWTMTDSGVNVMTRLLVWMTFSSFVVFRAAPRPGDSHLSGRIELRKIDWPDLFIWVDILIIDHHEQGRFGRCWPILVSNIVSCDYVDDLAAFWQQESSASP